MVRQLFCRYIFPPLFVFVLDEKLTQQSPIRLQIVGKNSFQYTDICCTQDNFIIHEIQIYYNLCEFRWYVSTSMMDLSF